jgi:hypothetical protein
MGFLDRLLGREDDPRRHDARREPTPVRDPYPAPAAPGPAAARSDDELAIDRYRYLLRTAPPEAVEQAHAEAFARLTPEQRRQVLTDVGAQVPPAERATSDDPQALARMATRAEMREPGTFERTFAGRGSGAGVAAGGGIGLGGVIAGSLLASVAGAFIGTAVAGALLDAGDGGGADTAGDGDANGAGDAGAADGSADSGGTTADSGTSADAGWGDTSADSGGDWGGDVFGGFGGDSGGGFGGDFGGDF